MSLRLNSQLIELLYILSYSRDLLILTRSGYSLDGCTAPGQFTNGLSHIGLPMIFHQHASRVCALRRFRRFNLFAAFRYRVV